MIFFRVAPVRPTNTDKAQGSPRRKPRMPMALQGKVQQARELLAIGSGLRWFMEGFATLDLKEAKAPCWRSWLNKPLKQLRH